MLTAFALAVACSFSVQYSERNVHIIFGLFYTLIGDRFEWVLTHYFKHIPSISFEIFS